MHIKRLLSSCKGERPHGYESSVSRLSLRHSNLSLCHSNRSVKVEIDYFLVDIPRWFFCLAMMSLNAIPDSHMLVNLGISTLLVSSVSFFGKRDLVVISFLVPLSGVPLTRDLNSAGSSTEASKRWEDSCWAGASKSLICVRGWVPESMLTNVSDRDRKMDRILTRDRISQTDVDHLGGVRKGLRVEGSTIWMVWRTCNWPWPPRFFRGYVQRVLRRIWVRRVMARHAKDKLERQDGSLADRCLKVVLQLSVTHLRDTASTVTGFQRYWPTSDSLVLSWFQDMLTVIPWPNCNDFR
jgi:hypothetical protein